MNIQKETKITVKFSEEDWQTITKLQDLLNELERNLCYDGNYDGIENKAVTYEDFEEDAESQTVVKEYLSRIRQDLNELDAWTK